MEVRNNSWWSRRSRLEKKLVFLCSFGFVLSTVLIASIVFIAVYNVSGQRTCFSETCIEESARVLRYINQSYDPCDDFYKFSCGSFEKKTTIPDDKNEVTVFNSQHHLEEQMREILDEPIRDDEIKPFKDVKKFYRACSNISLVEDLGVHPVTNVLDAIGGWPVVRGRSWNKRDWNWQKSVISSHLHGYSVNNFLSMSVRPDHVNSLKRVVQIDEAILGLPREYLIKGLKEPFVKSYHEYQVDLAVLFGANRTLAEMEMKQALNFEIELAKISTPTESRRNVEKFYNPMTVAELQETYIYTGHDWLEYLNSILPIESVLQLNDTVVVGSKTYFENLGDLLAKTSRKVLANYSMWRIVKSSIAFLPNTFRERQQEYDKQRTGAPTRYPRWKECIDKTLAYFPHALGALYVRKYFDKTAKHEAMKMVNNIKDDLKSLLIETDWMDEETKKEANIKVDMMTVQIGYAEELLNDTAIDEYYNIVPVVVDEDKYYESAHRLIVAQRNRQNRKLRESIDKSEWTSYVTPTTVNAFYSCTLNSIKFPAAILQGELFNDKRPSCMNYGGIGFIIGHEITHGFDDVGRLFDGGGNLRNWWNNSTRQAFLDKAQCIINQYGNFTEPKTNMKLNGIRTQGENIADNGGIKISYRAYKKWTETNSDEKLPGLDYTPKQLFWISSAQIWCSVARKEWSKHRIMTNTHSPGMFRVNGPMGNMEEFSEDFQCASDSKMNPSSKCKVW